MTKTVGFQLVYRDNSFDTDNEYFITHRPGDEEKESETGKTDNQGKLAHAAPKTIQKTTDKYPSNLFVRFAERCESLPLDILNYCRDHI